MFFDKNTEQTNDQKAVCARFKRKRRERGASVWTQLAQNSN